MLQQENEHLKSEIASARIMTDWLKLKVNDLEAANKALMEKAYGVKLPVPVIERAAPAAPNPYKIPLALFEHIDDDTIKAVGAENIG